MSLAWSRSAQARLVPLPSNSKASSSRPLRGEFERGHVDKTRVESAAAGGGSHLPGESIPRRDPESSRYAEAMNWDRGPRRTAAGPHSPFRHSWRRAKSRPVSVSKMPLTQRHNKGRKPLVLPVAGKIGDFAPQARAENGHVQRRGNPVDLTEWKGRRPICDHPGDRNERLSVCADGARGDRSSQEPGWRPGRHKSAPTPGRPQLNGFQLVRSLNADSQIPPGGFAFRDPRPRGQFEPEREALAADDGVPRGPCHCDPEAHPGAFGPSHQRL